VVGNEALELGREVGEELLRIEGFLHRAPDRGEAGHQIGENGARVVRGAHGLDDTTNRGPSFLARQTPARRFDFSEVGCYNAIEATPRSRDGSTPPEETTMALNLRDFLAALGDDLIRVDDEVDPITQAGAVCSASPRPIIMTRLKGFPDWKLCDILVKDRARQAKALGTSPQSVVRELADRMFTRVPGSSKLVSDG